MTELEQEREREIGGSRTSLSNMMSSVRRRGPAADNTSPGLPESDNNYLQSDDEKIKFRILIKFGNLINFRRREQRSEFYQ